MEKYYRFAGVEIAVEIPDDKFYTEAGNLTPFEVNSVRDPHRFSFTVADTLDPPLGECIAVPPGFRIYRNGKRRISYVGSVQDTWECGYLRILHEGQQHWTQVRADAFPGKITAKAVLNSLEAERLVTEEGGFVFHCSYIALEDRAILFTAPSGTGKSTQADLWHNLRGAEIINGDRAVIRCVGDQVIACGIPFAGSSQYCLNRELPVTAVVYLGQAPKTSIRRLRGYEAFARIWEGCSINLWEPEQLRRVSALVEQVAATVAVYHLPCTPDESAVKALEKALREGSNHEDHKK